MTAVRPEARNQERLDKADGSAKPTSKSGEHGIVLDDKAQEQPNDRKRAQQDSMHEHKLKR